MINIHRDIEKFIHNINPESYKYQNFLIPQYHSQGLKMSFLINNIISRCIYFFLGRTAPNINYFKTKKLEARPYKDRAPSRHEARK